jgi:hypothetical protein
MATASYGFANSPLNYRYPFSITLNISAKIAKAIDRRAQADAKLI